MHVIRDLLDKQLLDRDGVPFARVDAVVAEVRDGAPPRVLELQLGFVPLARRLGAWAERWAEAMHKRWSVRRSARYAVPWEDVTEVHMHHISIGRRAEKTAGFDWERWLRRNVIDRIPGSGKDEEEQ